MGDSLVGNTVKLNSGGDVMTVREIAVIDGVEVATCEWFAKGNLKSEKFPVTMLIEVAPPAPRPRFKKIKRS
jgi:uncharacterized protein YodC (DUF2158 family)